MSWTASFEVSRDELGEVRLADIACPPPEQMIPEAREQIDVAVAAAVAIAAAVGRPNDRLYVSVSGHANEGHGPKDGWSPDALTVSVSARYVEATP